MPQRSSTPIRVAIGNDYEIVASGLRTMLAPHGHRVVVAPFCEAEPSRYGADVVLYDTFARAQHHDVSLDDLISETGARVVIFSWTMHEEIVRSAIARGAAGYLSKGLDAAELLEAIEAIHAGRVVIRAAKETAGEATGASDWPGRAAGLSARESEILAYIAQGLSNQEIAERSYITINSVKTHVRNAYRKIGVSRRSQAVAWGLQHGFLPGVPSARVDALPN